MEIVGLSLVAGGLALVTGSTAFLLSKARGGSSVRAETDDSLETINHYLREIRQQRNEHSERLLNGQALLDTAQTRTGY
jgi:hypothetical protein